MPRIPRGFPSLLLGLVLLLMNACSANTTSDTVPVINAFSAASSTITLGQSILLNWAVTGDSYLSSLSDPGGISGNSITNIAGNGYTVHYDSSLSANSALGGKTYSLNGSGQLSPR